VRDWSSIAGARRPLLAETLGLAMARRAADILERHRDMLVASGPAGAGPDGAEAAGAGPAGAEAAGAGPAGAEAAGAGVAGLADDPAFVADDAIFTAVLDAVNECLGRFDGRPADERWCDALLQLLGLAELAPRP
jgi:hypothetical protein